MEKMAITHRMVQASAAGGPAAPSTLQGGTFSTWLTRIVAIISACNFDPGTAETAPPRNAADATAVGRHSVSNPDLPRRIAERNLRLQRATKHAGVRAGEPTNAVGNRTTL